MALNSRAELEEERRLFYVALTRAEKKITLCFATSRFRFGSLLSCEPSRFIEEIDSQYLEFEQMTTRSHQTETSLGGNQSLISSLKNERLTTKLARPIDPNFVPEDTSKIGVGDMVEHNRFGRGKVLILEGEGNTKKIKVLFDEVGEKTLVLSFAKLRIIT
jgi:DNA helicase-2/ATP-dependent DNA helicase PcrA